MDLHETRSRLSADSTLDKTGLRKDILSLVYSYRFTKIKVKDGGREVWIYGGPERDYVIIPGAFCSCMDFTIRVVSRGETPYCKHLLGLEVARRLGKYREIEMEVQDVIKVVREVFAKGFSRTLHRILYKY